MLNILLMRHYTMIRRLDQPKGAALPIALISDIRGEFEDILVF